jgi:deoxyribodipyrimidine photolyase-related protein
MKEIVVDGVTLGEDTAQADTLRLILGDQLHHGHSWYRALDANVLYLMMEQRSETDIVLQHIQKLVGVFAAMRRFAAMLRSGGHRVSYLTINNFDNAHEFVGNVARILWECGARRLEVQEPEDYRVMHLLEPERLAVELSDRVGEHIAVQMVSTEHFLVERSQLDTFLPRSKRPVM